MKTKDKTLVEAVHEVKVAQKRLHEARVDFMKAYEGSLRNFGMEANTIFYNKAEDGLPKQMVEPENWN